MFLFIRSLFFSCYMVFSVITVTIFNLCLFFLPYKKRAFLLLMWAKTVLFVLSKSCGIKINITGLENIPNKPCIVFSNHQSTLETLILQTIFIPHVWVIKRELLWIPFFGWSIALSKAIAINRKDGKKALRQVMKIGKQRLDENFWVIIFPEGTRTLPGEKGSYKIGGPKLAEFSKKNIVPVAHNCGLVWRKGQFIKTPGEVTLSIGKVIDCSEMNAKQILNVSQDWIASESNRLLNESNN